ncbi:unnamed protein product [Prunus armeniaca]|uniref:Cyclic nucleotide-binding domain-containing protein n=1 Tax=Prunus armeniaca TaxID=36596 RepID=A0A6J5Y2F1_PRUAR|nr:unnamed protein product [Prunus armeniaca]
MSKPVKDVSIELSELEQIAKWPELELEQSTSTCVTKKWIELKEAVVVRGRHHRSKWDMTFAISSAFAVFIDPLICYAPVLIDDSTCYYWDQRLMWTFFALRSAADLFYATDIFVFLSRSRAEPFGTSWTRIIGGPHTKICKMLNGKKTLRFLCILPRICAALPILQLFGALWYIFAVGRKIGCWQEHVCKFDGICGRETLDCFFYCSSSTPANNMKFNSSLLQKSCAAQLSENVSTLPFDFGIYLYALQSDMTRSRGLPVKMLQCLWWGLRNLSSFGSNLQTSFFMDEIIFSILISISGLALFLVYLNARVQGSQKILDQLNLREKMRRIYPQIINQMRIMCRLRLDSLKKVPMLKNKDEKMLQAICEHLKPVTYGEDIYIIREGEPLRKMLFITQGTALTYTTIKGGTNVCKCLEKSDFYGEELLNWAFKFGSFSELPISPTTVVSQTKVEAFSIRANHLKSVVAQFWWRFQKELPRSQLEHFSASCLQKYWRHHKLTKNTGSKEKRE